MIPVLTPISTVPGILTRSTIPAWHQDGKRLQATGHPLQATGHPLQATGHPLHSLQAIGHPLQATSLVRQKEATTLMPFAWFNLAPFNLLRRRQVLGTVHAL